MNGWHDAPHFWWRYLLLPFSWETCRALGWVNFSAFGFVFFWMLKLTPEEDRIAISNGRKIKAWAMKNGTKVE